MKFTLLIPAVTLLGTTLSTAALAQAVAPAVSATAGSSAASNSGTPVTRGEFDQMVKDAILKDPTIIMQAVQKLREKQEAENKKATAESFQKHKAALLSDTISPSIGDAKAADVTIIEFFDYQCGYCKKLLPTLAQLVNDDKKVRVIFREYPILSEESVNASRAALAAHRIAPDKYFAFHTELMKNAKYDEENIVRIAANVGIDTNALKAEMQRPEITDILDQNRKIGEDLGVRGTPAIFVGDKMLPGAVPYDTLKRIVGEVRAETAAIAPAAGAKAP